MGYHRLTVESCNEKLCSIMEHPLIAENCYAQKCYAAMWDISWTSCVSADATREDTTGHRLQRGMPCKRGDRS